MALHQWFMIVMDRPIGPFGSLDIVGLDVVWHTMQNKAKAGGDPQVQAAADRFKKEYIDKGWLGVKTGRGFHTYPDPAYARPDFLTGEASPRSTWPLSHLLSPSVLMRSILSGNEMSMEPGTGDHEERDPTAQPHRQPTLES